MLVKVDFQLLDDHYQIIILLEWGITLRSSFG